MKRPLWVPEVRDLMALMVIGAMIGMLYILLLRSVSVPDNQTTSILIGGFMTATTAVIQFYFGSSKGSVAKDDTINAMATTTAAATAVTPETPKVVTVDPLAKWVPAPVKPAA